MNEPITLFFQNICISFYDTADRIRAKRYDFSQFGEVIDGEGDGWQSVVMGIMATMTAAKYIDDEKGEKR